MGEDGIDSYVVDYLFTTAIDLLSQYEGGQKNEESCQQVSSFWQCLRLKRADLFQADRLTL